jgi:hypothetical protein
MPACLPIYLCLPKQASRRQERLRAGTNYLRAMGKPLCLLINFGQPKVEIHRIAAEACLRQGFGRQA